MTKANGKSLLDKIGAPGAKKDDMLSKMVPIPQGYTHMGLAQLDGRGMSVVVASEDWFRPLVWDFNRKEWVDLLRRTEGGVLQ